MSKINLKKYNNELIKENIEEILSMLKLKKESYEEIITKLKNYIYVSNYNELQPGTYIRWILLEKKPFSLAKGGVFCELKKEDKKTICVCKTIYEPATYFSITVNKCLVFKKLTQDEKLIGNIINKIKNIN